MREGTKRTTVELLRAAIEEQKREMPCDALHDLHGDERNICSDRDCRECNLDALRKAADLVEAELDALKARALPEGMEWLLEVWPKWSNGEYCKFGDWWKSGKYGETEPKQFRKLSIYTPEQLREWGQDDGDHFGYEWDFMRPSDPKYRPDKVEPPAPKVLDADGVEIRVGDDVWDMDGTRRKVRCLNEDGTVEFEGHEDRGWFAWKLTHQRPVLDADGAPIHEGDTVWDATTSAGPFTVREIERSDDPDEPEDIAWCGEHAANGFKVWRIADHLTHTKPEIDSWERIEEDAGCTATKYNKRRGTIFTTKQQVARDLVRRCRALAERERGE